MPAIPRFLTALGAGPAQAVRIASASVSGVSAALSSLTRRSTPVHTLTDGEGDDFTDDTAEIERAAAGPWSAARLRETLRTHLMGDRVIVLANREPILHVKTGNNGEVAVRHPASGLVTALEPVIRACSGVWVGHGSGSADRESSDSRGRLEIVSRDASYLLKRVWLSDAEEDGYYYGFSNEALWPLCHQAAAHPIFRRSDWVQYQRVNQKFADAVVAEAGCDDPIVLVQDYHFALVPKMLRRRLPRATVLTFWHIPWPNAERFSICPYAPEILEGLLGSGIIGFQTSEHCHNFLESVDRTLEVRIARHELDIVRQNQRTMVRPYPISIEWPGRWAANAPDVDTCRREVRASLGLPASAKLVVSVDRLDYTKGLEERLLSIEHTLEAWPSGAPPLAFVQVGAPSRTRIERYREFGDRVRQEVARLNREFGSPGYTPVTLIDHHCEPPEVFQLYRAADVCYVSSLHDGMNLVAKEFVSARDDERGVLVLSRFAGASRELGEALVVNPYDLEGVAERIVAALSMPEIEQRERMRALRKQVAEYNVYRWAGRMLLDATRLRQRERLHVRLSGKKRRMGGR